MNLDSIKGNLKVILEGRGLLTLRPNDHIATGGEGAIFRAGNTALKIYLKPEKVVWNDVIGKIAFFNVNQSPYIVYPKGSVSDEGGKVIGYYMDYVIDGEPIARVFTNDFWQRVDFGNKDAYVLVDRMRQIVQFAHSHNALLIDANELGYFVILGQSQGPQPRIIDVDSWVLANKFPPQLAIMPSIRDWHTKGWNQGSDWFAWGVVTFQVYTGIHPYKGRLAGYKPSELKQRMKDNASVFSSGIGLNHAVRDFSNIPGPLYDWYVATFQNGARSVPPSPFETGVAKAPAAQIFYAVTTTTGILVFEKLYGLVGDSAIRIFPCGVAMLNSGKLIDLSTKKEIAVVKTRDCEVVKVQGGWLIAGFNSNAKEINYSFVNEISFKEEIVKLPLAGYKLVRYENRLFSVTEQGLTEIVLKLIGKPVLAVGRTWRAMINSTRWFEGVGIQDAMGAMFVIAPFGDNSCAQVRVRELDGLRTVMAKAGNRFISVIGLDRNGDYQKVELTFDASYQSYKVWQEVTDSPDLNIAILPKMVCATIIRDGEIDIFVPKTGEINKVADKQVTTKMSLFNWDDRVVYIQDDNVWTVQMQ